MAGERIDLSGLELEKQYSGEQLQLFRTICNIFPPHILADAVAQPSDAALIIDHRFPKAHRKTKKIDETEAEKVLCSLWGVIIDIVQAVPCLHSYQGLIVELVGSLKEMSRDTLTIRGKEFRLWEDLPILGRCLKENWKSPYANTSAPDTKSIEKWKGINSFAARLQGKAITGWRGLAVRAMRAALEEPADDAELDCHLPIVREWIFHAGEQIMMEATAPHSDDADNTKAGSLYKGQAGLNLERWKFWKERLHEISQKTKKTSGDISKRAALIAMRMDLLT